MISSSEAVVVHHVTLEIPFGGENQARQFYGQLLGFPEMEIPAPLRQHEHGSVWFALNAAQQLHLGPVEAFRPQRRGHVAFLIQDLGALQRVFQQAGIAVQTAVPEPGWVRCYARDPFGNKLEFRQRLPAGQEEQPQ